MLQDLVLRYAAHVSHTPMLQRLAGSLKIFVRKARILVSYFSTRPRLPRPASVGIFLALLCSVFIFVRLVTAERESSVYVFPSVVSAEGWEEPTLALGQELSDGAELVDFDRTNSAVIYYGEAREQKSAKMSTTSDAVVGDEDIQPESTGIQELPSDSMEIPAVDGETPAAGTPEDEVTVTPELLPGVSPTITLPNPFIPDGALLESEVKSEGGAVDPAPTPDPAAPQSFLRGIKELFEPSLALAIEHGETPVSETTSDPVLDAGMATPADQVPVSTSPAGEEASAPPLSGAPVGTPLDIVSDTVGMSIDLAPEATGTDTPVYATSSEQPTLTPSFDNSDPYSVALCTTLGKPCHVMEFTGFGLGDVMGAHTLKEATLELSLAGRGAFTQSQYDRLLVRAYHAGRWEYLGEVVVRGELSNGKRGGYVSIPIPSFDDWKDLSGLKIALEYDRESNEDASVYVDGLWVNVRYASDDATLTSPDDLALSGSNLRSSLQARDAQARRARRDVLQTPSGEVVHFVHGETRPDATLVVKSDAKIYHTLGKSKVYFSVTNEEDEAEEVRVQFHFPESEVRINKLARFVHNVPHRVAESLSKDIGYFCDASWQPVPGEGEQAYRCDVGGELRMCDALNDDRTNCIAEDEQVGKTLGTTYRDVWQSVPLREGSFDDASGVFARAIAEVMSELPEGAIPTSVSPRAHIGESVLVPPGQTVYFESEIEVPLNGRGYFYVEALAPSGAYGLVELGWDGSWNHRFPVSIDTSMFSDDTPVVAVPITLSRAPEEFWNEVDAQGDDIRLVNERGTLELAHHLLSFDRERREGIIWARVPELGDGTSTTLYVYYGDKEAPSRSLEYEPFRTNEPTPRGVVFGGSQTDMQLHVIAYDRDTRVHVGDGDEVVLQAGESILIDNVPPGAILFADAPVVASIESVSSDVGYIPVGYAGTQFVLPESRVQSEDGDEVVLSALYAQDTHAVLGGGSKEEFVDPIHGTIMRTPASFVESTTLESDAPVALGLVRDPGILSMVYPSGVSQRFGVALGEPVVSIARDASAFTAICEGGARHDVDGRRRGMSVTLDRCARGVPALSEAIRVSGATERLSAYAVAKKFVANFLPEQEFAHTYISTNKANGVLALCAPATDPSGLAVYDPEGGLIASTTCMTMGERPGKAVLLATHGDFPSGFVVKVNGDAPRPALVYTLHGDLSNADELSARPLVSAPLSRAYIPHDVATRFGAVEFVVPGEHRALDRNDDGTEKEHVDALLTKDREFAITQTPKFRFAYKRQSNSLLQGVRDFLGEAPFQVTKVILKHQLFGDMAIGYSVEYGDGNEWALTIDPDSVVGAVRPGKYTLHIEIEEAGEQYIDEFDFFWGVLAINYTKSVYTPGEDVDIAIGALSNNGNTICDANLRLWVTSPAGVEQEVAVTPSGKCNGNNVVDVPDYSARFTLSEQATGTHRVRLVRLDEAQNVASQVQDAIEVRERVPFSIERYGPTRIYPLAHYPMKIRVRANEPFSGEFVERIPGDFTVIDRGNATLGWGDPEHTFITATWPLDLPAGGVIDLEYTFDAGDRSPYLYLLGPAHMQGGETEFVEARSWQIASDAAGKMLLFLENSIPLPSGWTCVSCISSDTFFERLAMGSTTYGGLGGTATHTPTAVAAVAVTNSTGVGPNTTNNTNNAPLAHTHTLTPAIIGTSNLPAYKDLRVIQANSAGDPGTIPTGAIGIFDVASSSLPVGWFRYDALDGRYVRGASSTSIGGSNTHVHNATGTLDAPVQSGIRQQNGVINGATDFAHIHTLTATNTNSVSHEPPYAEVVFAKLNTASGTPNYLITMWDNTPPDGWVTVSGEGGDLHGRFVKGSTTYGGVGGSSSHAHASIIGATTSVADNLNNYTASANNAQAPAAHIHDVDITGFSDDSHLPQYVEVIFAKRLSGVSFLTQDSYRIYTNANVLTPTDPWPSGGSDLDENTPIDSADLSVKRGDKIRLRMNVWVTNATSTVGTQAYKLQYATSTDCPNELNWSDVGSMLSGAQWRGFDNTSVTNHATLASTLLSSSTVVESYTEENNSTSTPTQIPVGGVGEWDWVVHDNAAVGNTSYCFRMVKSDGTPFDAYTNYPQVLTNAPPGATTISAPFQFEKVSTTTPGFQFFAGDTETNDLDYQIQVGISATFTSPTIDTDSEASPELFENVPNPANKAPFNSGDTIQFRPTSALSNGTTYWVRVRAKDTNGSNEWGAWSDAISFTVDTSVTASTWFQTTRDQFPYNTLVGVTTATDTMQLIVGSTTGSAYGPAIEFSQASLGTAWGSLEFTDAEASSDVKYQIEYFTSTSSWALLPETALSGNSAGFDTSPVSLLGVDPTVYDTLRLRANLTNSGASPSVSDWTLKWGYNVSTPVPTSPFDNQKVATRTPTFEWSASDPQGDAITYQISWSTSPNFTSSTTRESNLHAGFSDQSWATDTDPFGSGDRIRFMVQPADILASSTTYYWRVRGRDPAPGANTWSFWSTTRSIYVDTTVTVSTWFQTDDGQFNTDTLTSMYTTGTGSSTVSTTTDEIMIAYGEGSVQTPRYRIFDGVNLGAELSALTIGSTIQWLVLKASPVIGQYIMGTLGSDRDMNFQVYDNGAWGNLYEAGTNAPSVTRRSFDVAYETISGRALAVTCNSSPDADYRVWDGSAWSATGTINLSFTSNCEWVRLASDPTSNEIIGLFRNTGTAYEAQVWNATSSTWGNATSTGSMSEIAHEGMAVEYEASGNQAVFVVSNAGNASFISNFWNGAAWAGASTSALGNDFEWGNLRRNPSNDELALCYVDQDNDIGVKRWNGVAWVVPHTELDTAGTAHTGRITDCMFETTAGRTNYIATTYATTAGTGYRYWNTASWIAEVPIGPSASPLPTTFTHQLARTSASGTILGLFFDHLGTDYEFGEHYGTQAWPTAKLQTIEDTSSVTATPYGEPFYMASKNPATRGTIISSSIDYDDGGSPAWKQALWEVSTPGSSNFLVQVQYYTASGTWALIPDGALPGNSAGTSTSPITLTSLDTNTYNVLRLKGNATCVLGSCPTLHDWTVEWAAGVRISGIARENDLTTLTTSGTVAVAVGGTLQQFKTGVIDASGNWYIDNVTVFPGNVLTVFVDGASDADEAVAVAKYTGPGDAGGMLLAKHWLTAGSGSTTGQTLTLTDIGRYDNSISGDEDIFFDVDAGGDYNNCASGACIDSSIYAYANTLRFSTSSSETINTWDLRTLGSLYGDTNTIKVGGSWRNLGTFIPNTSTVVFNGTSSTRTIDSTGAIASTFYHVTFGESGSTATWNFLSALTATGTVSVNFGTTSPGIYALTLQGDLTIGSSGTFTHGSATTTFSGAVSKTWTDNTASKQNLGNILVDGSTKTVTLASSVRAANVTVGADDTLSLGGSNTLYATGYFNNLGTFTAVTGTVDFAATTTAKVITLSGSNLYNATFSGVGGTWSFASSSATTTNDFLITGAGTTTLPAGTLAVGGAFNNSGGAFVHSGGEVRLTTTGSGRTVRANGSNWSRLTFAGSGGSWTMADTNATTTGTLQITAGTPTFPSGTLAVGDSFDNTSGAFIANGGTIKMTSTSLSRTIRLNGSSLASLLVSGSGTFTMSDANATATADVLFTSGTTTLPATIFAIGGSLSVTAPGAFDALTNTVKFNPTSGTKTVDPFRSVFSNVEIAGSAPGVVQVTAHATATNFSILSGGFTQNSATDLWITGTFLNQTGGASTTWTGSTLKLMSGTEYAINAKTTGGDAYATVQLGVNTKIKSWNSSTTAVVLGSGAYHYAQDYGAVDGELRIFGAYVRTTGTEYWSAQTDFDGTTLATSSHRAVAVKFDSSATANFTNVGLEVLGTSTATTTVSRISSGLYGVTVASSTINANYYQFNYLNSSGLQLTGSTTITSMDFGNFELDTNGGSLITVASTTINHNSGAQIFNVRFALGSAVAGFNVNESDVANTSSYIRFKRHGGNLAGEANDIDPLGNPGHIRWDDSNFIISISGTVFSDAGATEMTAPVCDGVTSVVTVKVTPGGLHSAPCQGSGVATGTYTISGVTFSGETTMTVFLNGASGGARAVTITKSASSDLTGINLYQDRVIVRHEDVSVMTISDMSAYDSSDDVDIPFTATTSPATTLSVNPETEFWVWSGKTFVPGGDITLNSGGSGNNWDGTFHVDNNAVFTAVGAQSHSVGGRFVVDSGGTFTSASSTFIFTATTSGKVITGVSALTFWNVTTAGVGGNWSVNQTVNVLNDLFVNAGTLSGANSVTVSGDNASGNGAIALTGGTFTFANGGSFGGSADWSFNHLTLSGSGGTTTKNASSTITVAGILTISAGHTLLAGTPSVWNLSGGGTPFVVNGSYVPQTSTMRYSATTATNIGAGTYYRLHLAPTSGGPTYTLSGSPTIVSTTLLIGDGANAGTTTANTNDGTLQVFGDLIVTASSTFVASNSGAFELYRDLLNQGSFTHSGGTTLFLATSTGRSITMASSSLYNAHFQSGTGGWAFVGNATTSNNLLLSSAGAFSVASGTTLEVRGTFTNNVGGASTTWLGTLYLNSGTSFSVNASSTGADRYDTLIVGANTDARMWNSVATSTVVSPTGSLYSQMHDGVNGSLYIWGEYVQNSSTDYWSYATDFDGTTLAVPRAVNVQIASSSSVTFGGSGALELYGAPNASTTVQVQGSGAFAFNISNGSTTMGYFTLRNTDTNGLNLSGNVAVNAMSDGDFELSTDGGSMITVTGGVIDANPLKIFMRNRFATGTGITAGNNVRATGVSASAWRFNLHTGNRAGEAYDSDPGGDPGYIIWDDSAAQITISGNVYADEGGTPIGAPTCNGVTQNVRLRVQGAGVYTSACDAGTGAFSISSIIFNPGDTLSLYLDTNGGARAANISLDPATNINNMHLYRDFVIVRHEQGNPMTISAMDQYDSGNDTDVPFTTTLGAPNTLTLPSGIGLIVWSSKVFTPGGNVTVHGNASSSYRDGTVKLYATSTWSSAGTQIHTLGGNLYASAGASIAPANSTFVFNATTTGKLVSASSSLTFYNLTLGGASGTFDIGGVGTTSNDLLLTSGTTTLPAGTLAVGGSFDANGATFIHNSGTVKFTSGASGKSVRANGSSFSQLLFAGSGGGWTFLDTNATTTGSLIITAGAVTLPNRVLAVGEDFDNQSGTFSASASSTLRMTSATTGRTIRLGGSSLGGLHIAASGTYTFADANATTTSDVNFALGTTTLPYNAFATFGSYTNSAIVIAGTSTVSFTATTGAVTMNTGSSTLGNVIVNGAGQFTISSHATTTQDFILRSAGAFTLATGRTLAVGGVFGNAVGGAATTWANATLLLYGGGEYAINTKSSGGDAYGTLSLNYGSRLSAWNSTSTNYLLSATSSLYSQDHNAVDGDLYIFGQYRKLTGTDYWSYATDFDGTALGGSSRQVDVRFASSASAYFATGTTLQILGASTATSTVDAQAGFYDIEVQSGYLNAGYYQFKNTNRLGLFLSGTTTLSAFNNGDFEVGFSGGSAITIASTTVDQNASSQYFYHRFATSSGVFPATNIYRLGTTTNAINFFDHVGAIAGEAYDVDGIDACGSIRWVDSACLFSDQKNYRWRNDDGGEGAPSSEWYDQNWTKRKRVRLTNNAGTQATNTQFRIQVTYDADMQSDFDDLRFTDSSGTTSIAYWLESYSASATGTVWVKVPDLPATSYADIFMYYGNSGATSGSVGTSTFIFFDDFEDASLSEYSGDTSLFEQSTSFNYERTRGLDASAGNEGTGKTTDGIGVVSAGVGRNTTLRFYQYIDMTTGGADEPCMLFAIQSPLSNHQNYGVCLSPFGTDEVTIVRNAANNGRNDGSTLLSSKTVTYSTGWYEVAVNWLESGNAIDVTVYDASGNLFATTSATDSTYTSGGIGFSYWSQHGGWDIPHARKYISATPTVQFFVEQGDSGATWKDAENAVLMNQVKNQNVRLRLTVRNTGGALTDQNFRLQVASKSTSPNCESVPTENYADITTTTGSCGSSPACMKTSTQFTDRASSTQLLTVPTGMTFTQGQIMEDPSNQTGSITIASGEFTEVEYNFQMTEYATQNAYCFRTTKAGTALDNYTKVAELRMLHIPTLSEFSFNSNRNISLVEGATTTIYATSTVTDFNGYSDIVNASSTYFRSGLSSTTACFADGNNCYQIATTSCAFQSCAGNSCTVSCSADMYYFADPTDAGSAYASEDWRALIDVWDNSGSHATASSSQELYTVRGFSIPATLSYGAISVGADTGATNSTTTVTNTGNVVLNLDLGGDPLTAGASTINYDKQKYATTTFTYSSCPLCNILTASSSPTYYPIAVTKPTSTLPFFKDIYWGIAVPIGTPATTHSGVNYFTAQ